MKSLLIDMSFHAKTGSASFIKDILSTLGEVDVMYDDSFSPRPQCEADLSKALEYDLVWVHQQTYVALICARIGVKNLVFSPMYDSGWPDTDLTQLKEQAMVICFSSRQYFELQSSGFKHLLYVKYFPKPSEYQISDFKTLRPFFMQRRQMPDWKLVREILGDNHYEKINYKYAPDYNDFPIPNLNERHANKLEMTGWTQTKEQGMIPVKESNLYFAPREIEGIGLAFLDAMAMGIPVVSPNRATANEYICHNVTGWLYEMAFPEVLPQLTEAKLFEMSRNVREYMEAGYRQWKRDVWEIKNFVMPYFDVAIGGKKRALRIEGVEKKKCLITVCVVVRNDAEGFRKTINSLSNQVGDCFDVVCVDGNSDHMNMTQMIKYISKYDKISGKYMVLISEPDKGIYDGMNKAARLATTDYIIFINAGDSLMRDDSLFELEQCLIKNDYPDFVAGSFCYHNEFGVDVIKWLNLDPKLTYKEAKDGKMTARFFDGVPNHNSTLIKRELLLRTPYDLSFKVSADTNHYFLSIEKGATIAVAPVLCTRLVAGGISTKRRIVTMENLLRKFMLLTTNKKGVHDFVKQLMPREIKATSVYGFKLEDYFFMLKEYPLTSLKKLWEIAFDKKTDFTKKFKGKNVLIINTIETIKLQKILEKFTEPVSILASFEIKQSLAKKFPRHNFLTRIVNSNVRNYTVVATGLIAKEQRDFLKSQKIYKFYSIDEEKLEKVTL